MDGLSLHSKILTGFRKPCCLVKLVSPYEEIGDHQVIGRGDGRVQEILSTPLNFGLLFGRYCLVLGYLLLSSCDAISCMCFRELETATLDICSHSISYIVRAIHIERLEIKSTCILEAYDIKSIVHRNYLAEIRFFGCLHVSFYIPYTCYYRCWCQ